MIELALNFLKKINYLIIQSWRKINFIIDYNYNYNTKEMFSYNFMHAHFIFNDFL